MEIFLKVFDVLFPVFLTIFIGYLFGKKDPKFDTKIITNFAGSIGLPCIIFYSLTITNIQSRSMTDNKAQGNAAFKQKDYRKAIEFYSK